MPVLYDSAVVLDNFILFTLKFYYITCNQLPLQTFIYVHSLCISVYTVWYLIYVCICMYMYGSAVIFVGRSEGEEI